MNFGLEHMEQPLALSAGAASMEDKIDMASIDDMFQMYVPKQEDFSGQLQFDPPQHPTRPAAQWRGQEVVEWAERVARQQGLDPFTLDLWRLRNTCGRQLLALSHSDLTCLVGEVTATFLLPHISSLASTQGDEVLDLDETSSAFSLLDLSENMYDQDHVGMYDQEFQGCGIQLYQQELSCGALGDMKSEDNEGYKDISQFLCDDSWLHETFNLDPLHEHPQLHEHGADSLCLPLQYEASQGGDSMETLQSGAAAAGADAAPDTDLHLPGSDLLKKIPSRTRKRERGPKSWEFLMRLLMDPRTNPSVIRWEDEASATFRLMKPKLIADLWSNRTSGEKRKLSYNNFARGLRHHYTTGALHPVMEKQLVYRCGTLALQYLQELQQAKQI